MTDAVEGHAGLIDAGWTTGLDGRWRSPDPAERRAYTLDQAWRAHLDEQPDNHGGDAA